MSLTIAAPNGKRFQVKTADVEDHPPRNDDEINGGLSELETGADELKKQREDKLLTENEKQQQLTKRAVLWKEKLETEIKDREVQNTNLKEHFDMTLKHKFAELSTFLNSTFEKYEEKINDPQAVVVDENQSTNSRTPTAGTSRPPHSFNSTTRVPIATEVVVPPAAPPKEGALPLEMRVRIVNTDFEHFRDVEVPEKRDNETGKIERTLKKYQESFDIDNAKLVKREEKIRDRLEEFKDATKHSFDDEKMTRKYKYLEILENLDDISRKEDRESERLHTDIMLDIAAEQKRLHETVEMRGVTDTEIVENIKASMQRMQAIVLKHFGLNRAKKGAAK